jgi:hypothetical protein
MPRTFTPLLLALSLLVPPGRVLAGPPEGISGRMVVDEVSEGLRNYRRESDAGRRVRWLAKLAPTRDPRVGVAMGEYLSSDRNPFPWQISVGWLLTEHFMPPAPASDNVLEQTKAARGWWRDNEADLRRRARQLP